MKKYIKLGILLLMVMFTVFLIALKFCENDNIAEEVETKSKYKLAISNEKEDVDRQVDIRVLIMTDDFENIFHSKATLKCDSDCKLIYGDKEKIIKAGKTINIGPESKYFKKGKIKLVPTNENAKIELLTIERQYGNPKYFGSIELDLYDDKILITNEVSIEEYLYGVVPSEMPSNYEKTALMVQAVCARTYAYSQVLSESYKKYNAHVDDSVNYQVYNNVEPTEDVIEAVDETCGMIITYENEPINALFFSTSCGATTIADIWGNKNFPYIKSVYLSDKKGVDLSKEENFDEFIRKEADTYDKDYDLYRWSVMMSADELSYSVNKMLPTIDDVKRTYVGEVKDIEIIKRGKGGIIKTINIKGSEGNVKVRLQSNIRKLFDISNVTLYDKDGEKTGGFDMLPSGYFVVDKVVKEGKLYFEFIGGGFGHGVGMSQNATRTMAEKGMTYEQIIKFFYNKVEIKNMYEL
ncbi:MAG: SpoIID/LytB domain-containing protein [Lachnospiraceae bacterium]|nr:SpoIID/LytB domain-containing protein [Lachnospiraceae bacterium]